MFFLFIFKKFLFIFTFGCAGSSLLCELFSSCSEWRLLSSCNAWLLIAVASLVVEHNKALGYMGFSIATVGSAIVAPRHRLNSHGAWA